MTGLWVQSGAGGVIRAVHGEFFDLQDTSTHSMNAVRLSRGPSPDSCACVMLFSPAWQKVQRQLSG